MFRRMNKYRVIYNQDCTNLFHITQPIQPEHVKLMVDEVADGGVDLMLINPNAQKTNYPGDVWETYWEEGDFNDCVKQMRIFAEQGHDYLKLALQRCREKSIAPGVSIRMNDMHGAQQPDTHPQNSRFYKSHPEYRLLGPVNNGWGRIGLNYEHEPVRLHYLALIREIVERYDFDVLELDFMRFSDYFPFRDYEKHCAVMTEFIKQVRKITNQKQDIALYIRVASTPAAAYELGFDLETLVAKKFIDGIIFTEFLNTGWEMPVDEFRAIVGQNVALYAGADVSADRRPGLPIRYMPHNELLMRGFAYAYLSSGADGVYFFNFFTLRESGKDSGQLRFDIFKQIKSIETMRNCPKAYLITSNISPCCETDLPHQIPVNIGFRQSRRFDMLVGKESDHCRFLVRVVLTGDISREQLFLRCNQFTAGSANQVKNVSVKELSNELTNSQKISGKVLKQVQAAEFFVPARAIRNGRNVFVLRNDSDNEITIHGIETYVLPLNEGGKI